MKKGTIYNKENKPCGYFVKRGNTYKLCWCGKRYDGYTLTAIEAMADYNDCTIEEVL